MTVSVLSLPAMWTMLRTQFLARRFVQDVGVLTIANLAGAALNFVQGVLVARWLGPELYGVTALVMSYPSLVFSFFDMRSTEASVKYLSEFYVRAEPDRALAMCRLGYTVDLAIATLASAVVLMTAQWAAASIAHRPEATWLIVTYALGFIPQALVGTSYGVLATLGRFPLIAWVNILTTLVRVTLVLGLVLAGWQVRGVVFGNAVATMAIGLLYGSIALVLMQRTWGGTPLRGDWQALKGRRREIFAFLVYNDLNTLLGIIPKQLDVVFLGYLRGPTEVGYYRLAKAFGAVVGNVVSPLQSVSYSRFSHAWGMERDAELRRLVRRLACLVGIPLGVLVLASLPLLPVLTHLMVGEEYGPAIVSTQILLIGSAIWLISFWLRPLLLASRQISFYTKLYIISILPYPMIFLFLVPKLGAKGMAIGYLCHNVLLLSVPGIRWILMMLK